MTQLTTKPIAFFKADPNQPRKHFDEAALQTLGESLRVRQNDPVQSQPDGTIIDGERRLRAAMLVGLEELDVIITDTELTDSQISMIRLTSFFHREDLTAYEKWSACKQILELNPVWTAKELAGHLHIDPSMVTRLLSPSKCTPAWQEALKDRRVGISDVYAASKLPEPHQQAELLAMRLAGASRDAIEKAGRKKRAADVPAVKVNRVKCLLSSGVQIVVSGTRSLDECIEAATELLKEMKRARDLGYTSKTFAAAMRDKARKA